MDADVGTTQDAQEWDAKLGFWGKAAIVGLWHGLRVSFQSA
jgi:hypothetical protein